MYFYRLIILCLIVPIGLGVGCRKKNVEGALQKPPVLAASKSDVNNIEEAPIAEYQRRLLDLAIEIASKIPVYPHIKDRSRAQYEVGLKALELHQPKRALAYFERIENWRCGAGYADLAIYFAKNNRHDVAQAFIQRAQDYLDQQEKARQQAKQDAGQEWRTDMIRSKMAQAYVFLSLFEKADQLALGSESIYAGDAPSLRAALDETMPFEKRLEVVQKTDIQTERALDIYVKFYEQIYQNPDQRAQLETQIQEQSKKIPVIFAVRTYQKLAQVALDNKDYQQAAVLAQQADQLIDAYRWDLEYWLPLKARSFALRYGISPSPDWVQQAENLVQVFEERKQEIVDVFRAKALIPLAEAFQKMGQPQKALEVYDIAITEAMINPNSRPRAEDLSAVCASMAAAGIEPDQAFWEKLTEFDRQLGNPW